MNKSAWVRSQPDSLKASEVVTKGASEGIKLTLAQVYVVRGNAKRKAAKGGSKRAVGRPKFIAPKAAPASTAPSATTTQASTASNPAHSAFAMAALDIGLHQAEQLLRDLRSKLNALYP